ncbi:hypothetical protein AGMMS49940_17090 [Spirochaetia bacterium]|nr:hypothetical protein AGMMS49940_17090 [Spirochaetia bacterium]
MPWRLIGLALVFVVFLAFTGFNLGNRCNISFIFFTVKEVPVFLPIFASFVVGLLCAIPFAVSIDRKRSKPDKKKLGKGDPAPGPGPEDLSAGGPYGID